MPSDIHRNYGNAVSAIYRDMGRAKAEARLQQGQGWSNAIGNIGQTIANIPSQMAEQRQQEMRSALTDLQMQEVRGNLERAKQQDAQTMAIANLVSQSTIDGVFDKTAFSTAAAAAGMWQIVPEVIKTFADSERALIELEDAQAQGQLTDAKLAELQQSYLRPFALQLWENKFDPTVVNGAFAAMKAQGVPEELLSQWQAMPPEQLSLMVQQLLPRAAAPEPVTLSEGQVRLSPQTDQYGRPVMGPDGQPVMTRMEGNAKPMTLEQQLAAAVAAKNGAEVSRIRNEMARAAAATRAPEKATFEWAKLPDGTVRYMTPQEIRAQGATKAEAPKPNTEDEKKAYGFAVQMGQAVTLMDELEGKLTDAELYQIQTLPQEALIGWANRKNTSEAAKRYLRAFEQFTESRLRPVSGAAIADSEYARDRRTYAKQFGETPQLAADRKAARLSALQALQTRSGSLHQPATPTSGGGGIVSASTPPPDQSGNWKWDGQKWVPR